MRALIPVFLLVVCYLARKRQLGGWLLYYIVTFYYGFLLWIGMSLTYAENYLPESWETKKDYFMYLLANIPNDLIMIVSLFLVIALSFKKEWGKIIRIRWATGLSILSSLISVLLTFFYFKPEDGVGALQLIGILQSSIWFAYFLRSKRVASVFKNYDWPTEGKISQVL